MKSPMSTSDAISITRPNNAAKPKLPTYTVPTPSDAQTPGGREAERGPEIEDRNMSESFHELFQKSVPTIKEGEVVRGKVLTVDEDHVQIDVGFKSEGLVDKDIALGTLLDTSYVETS